jgi:hypothetical protein
VALDGRWAGSGPRAFPEIEPISEEDVARDIALGDVIHAALGPRARSRPRAKASQAPGMVADAESTEIEAPFDY